MGVSLSAVSADANEQMGVKRNEAVIWTTDN